MILNFAHQTQLTETASGHEINDKLKAAGMGVILKSDRRAALGNNLTKM